MGDGISDAYAAVEEHRKEAEKKFGHLSDDELQKLLQEEYTKYQAVKAEREELDKRYFAVQKEYELLQSLFFHRMERKKW